MSDIPNTIRNGDFKDSKLAPWTADDPKRFSFDANTEVGVAIYLKEGNFISQPLDTLPPVMRLEFDVKLVIPQDEAAIFTVSLVGFGADGGLWSGNVAQLATPLWQHFSLLLEPQQKLFNAFIQAQSATPFVRSGQRTLTLRTPEHPYAPIAFANFKLT